MDGVAGGGPALLPLPCDTTLQLLLRISTHIERAPLDPKYRRLNTSAGSKFHSLGLCALPCTPPRPTLPHPHPPCSTDSTATLPIANHTAGVV